MNIIEDIKKAVSELRADEFAKFRAWFDEFEARRFDEAIGRDARAGKLDKLTDEARYEFREGRMRN